MITPPRLRCPPSYYEATRATAPEHPALAGDVTADVCVLGGGFTGVSAALHLAEAGRRVVLLEAVRIGAGASGRNGGISIPGYRVGPGALLRAFGRADAQRLWACAMDALALQRRLIDTHRIDCAFERAGWVHAAVTRAAAREAAAAAALLREVFDYPDVEALDQPGIAGLVRGEGYVGGLIDRGGGHLHPLNYALGLAAAATGAGAALHEQTRALSVRRTASGVTVGTASGTVRAAHAIIACDALAGAIDPAFAPLTMDVSNFLVATEPLGDRLAEALPSRAAVSDTRFVLDYYRPTADGRLIFGGGEKWRPGDPPDIAEFVRPYLARTFPKLAAARLDYAWSGTVAVTMTRSPSIGRRGAVWWALGYSGQGVVVAPYAGAVLAAAIAGETSAFDLVAGFEPGRFPGGRLARTPLYIAGMAYYALRDRLGLALDRLSA